MSRKLKILGILALLVLLLSGCQIRTIEDLYCLPKRSQDYEDLQKLIDRLMIGLDYSAPISGVNRQTVQMEDLDGDGNMEYILFARGTMDKPLQLFIFGKRHDNYELLDRIEGPGTDFEQVEYVSFTDDGSTQLVIGRQLSDQVIRSVSVYSMRSGQLDQIMTASCSRFICGDLNGDRRSELMLLRPGSDDSANGVAEFYHMNEGKLDSSGEIPLSRPADKIRRTVSGKLLDGTSAVFVTSDVGGSFLITDVFSMVDGALTNVTYSQESGISAATLINYPVYPQDIDGDGILELPSIVKMTQEDGTTPLLNQHLIRWYSLSSDGSQVDKLYTYHNFEDGWYVQLSEKLASRLTVVQRGNSYEFRAWNEDQTMSERIMSIHVLTGQKREEQAVINNRFVIHRTDSTVYAADLDVASGAYGLSKNGLITGFRLIDQN